MPPTAAPSPRTVARRDAGSMKFAIRDDDTCYFTDPADLERVYHDVWEQVPVCLATVPFAIGYERAGIPREHWHDGEAFALERNGALTAFLDTLSSSVNSGDVFVQRQLTTTDLKDYAARTYRGSGTLMTMASE